MQGSLPAIGKYKVLRELGRGAGSTVYLAEDPFKNRKVALKRIHAHLLTDPEQASRYRKNLRNECLLAGQLRHPHIVAVHDADGAADPPYLVLEYVEGAPLSVFTRPDRLLPVEQVLDIAYKCCSALEYANSRGLVHRDIKPANLLLQTDGEVKLTDFGAALSSYVDITQQAGLVGTPAYMSPEQVRESPITFHSDMFSLAVVLYELLTARKPFDGDTDFAVMYKIGSETPTAPSVLRPGLPRELDAVLARAMAKKPEDRYPEWMDFAKDILAVKRVLPGRQVQFREGEAFARMRKLAFFADFPDQLLWETLRLGTLTAHRGGTALMREGEAGNSFHVLIMGRVYVLRSGTTLATLDAGVTLGEMAYLQKDNPHRTATAIAETDVLVLEIRSDALRKASDDLQVCFDKAFIQLLLERLDATSAKLGQRHLDGVLAVD